MSKLSTASILCIIAAVASVVGLAKLPYGYYTLLRFLVCAACVAAWFALAEAGRQRAAIPAIVLGLIYNPIIRVHLDRETWEVLNVASAAVCAYLAWSCPRAGVASGPDVGQAGGASQ